MTTAPGQQHPKRGMEDGMFVSMSTPAMAMKIDPRFQYVGEQSYVLKETAGVNRHHWVDADRSGNINALFVLQFEGFLEDIDNQYRFGIPKKLAGSNYRYSPQQIQLGQTSFVHNTWAFDNLQNAQENPTAESANTLAFLQEKGFKLHDELIMSRFARAVGANRRNELIIFYFEPLSLHERTLADFGSSENPSSLYDDLSAIVTKNSIASFALLPGQE